MKNADCRTSGVDPLKRRDQLKTAIRAAFPHTIPVMAGFLVLGIAYGMIMKTKGYSAVWAVMMSAVAFCGSMQFVAISLMTSAFDPIGAFLLSLMVNARHLFYGISMLEKYKGLGAARPVLIYTLCDETFSISSGIVPPEGINKKYFYLSISLLGYFYWIGSTFLGSVAGGLFNFDMRGLDFVLTALFVVLFIDQIKKKDNRAPGLIGVLCATVCLAVLGAERFVIPAMLLILAILLSGRNRLCR